MEKYEELFGKDCRYFKEVDPFNPQNIVSGYISNKSTELYGALLIYEVNDKKFNPPQLVMAVPKMHYPFISLRDGTRKYSFPMAKCIEIYEKLDGTSILAFSYIDNKNYKNISYKTRLRPFLSSGRFGDFYNMWNEVAIKYKPDIELFIRKTGVNLSFELYGARNPHLVMYSNSLDFALLFGVTNSGQILSPKDLNIFNIPFVTMMKEIDRDYVFNYESLQKELESKIKKADDNYYTGLEGTVWYLKTVDGKCVQLKCKPETIEAIHFSAGAGGLSKNIIIATCWNALENTDTLTVEFIKQLLLEEFTPQVIEAHHYEIEKSIEYVTEQLNFRQKVLEEYRKTKLNILLQKAEVMKLLSTKFNKKNMRKVYSVITNFG